MPRPPARGAYLELQGSGDAIECLQTLLADGLSVAVQVDEPGSHHQAAGVNPGAAVEVRLGDSSDLVAGDADVAYGVESGLRVDNST